MEFDSRKVSQGGLFVAFPGERVDGHDYAAGAISAGAVAVLGTREVPGVPMVLVGDALDAMGRLARAVVDRLPGLTVIGLTGSSGKTTTKDLIAQLAVRLGPTVAPPGSFNNELGHPYTALQATPETRYLVMEKGARGVGHVRYLCEVVPPRISVVLNVGVAHLGEFGSVETIALAKGELVEALPVRRAGGAQRRRPAGGRDVGAYAGAGGALRRVGARRRARRGRDARRPGPAVVHACHPGGERAGAARADRPAPGLQLARRGGGRPRAGPARCPTWRRR